MLNQKRWVLESKDAQCLRSRHNQNLNKDLESQI